MMSPKIDKSIAMPHLMKISYEEFLY